MLQQRWGGAEPTAREALDAGRGEVGAVIEDFCTGQRSERGCAVQAPGSVVGLSYAGRGQQRGGHWIGTVVAPGRHSSCKECGYMADGKHTLYGAWCLPCPVAEGERGPTYEP